MCIDILSRTVEALQGEQILFFFLTASACTAVGLSEDGTEAFVFLYSVLPIWGRVSVAVPF